MNLILFIGCKKIGSRIPGFDLAYKFLLSQEDVRVNASPSITTVNNTKAVLKIVDEISVSEGTNVEKASDSSSLLKDSYSRRDYGIVLEMTPTIHLKGDGEEEYNSITLLTDIQFDSRTSSDQDRPTVTKRTIQNEVRIADGETVIIGGLRRKNMIDKEEKIPFLGELPGLGKLFGTTALTDEKTEMFIFLTPKIIEDPKSDFEKMRKRELLRRPGDIPEFMKALEEARERENNSLLSGTLKMLFGRSNEETIFIGEYDGR